MSIAVRLFILVHWKKSILKVTRSSIDKVLSDFGNSRKAQSGKGMHVQVVEASQVMQGHQDGWFKVLAKTQNRCKYAPRLFHKHTDVLKEDPVTMVKAAKGMQPPCHLTKIDMYDDDVADRRIAAAVRSTLCLGVLHLNVQELRGFTRIPLPKSSSFRRERRPGVSRVCPCCDSAEP